MFRSNGLPVRWRLSRVWQTDAASGFTLLEVVVALACIALILGAVLRVFSLGLQTADSARMRALGTMLAQSVLTEIAVSDPLTPREASGAFENGFRWSYRIGAYEESATPQTEEERAQRLQLYRLDVAVSWGRQDNPAGLVTLTTLRLSDGGELSAQEQISR
jgi:general secretion pathway protein I